MVRRLGFVVPSSNTVFEPEMARMVAKSRDVTAHVTRLGVTEIALERRSEQQFDRQPLARAAALLAEARVDVVTWAGTSGLWLGIEAERAMLDSIAAAIGRPVRSSATAVIDACRTLDARRVGLVTPYEQAVVDRIAATLSRVGIEVISASGLGISENFAFALVEPRVVKEHLIAASRDADAVIVACTNLSPGAALADLADFDTPVVDSIAATVWDSLGRAGVDEGYARADHRP